VAIIGQIVVESRRYSGWIDPRYPIGYWQAALTVTGDASGGDLGIDLVFQGAIPPALNSQLYSVERFAISSDESADRVVKVSAVGMAGPANQGFRQSYAILVPTLTAQGQGRARGDQFTMLPWFLGSQRTPGVTASFSLVSRNVNTVAVDFEAEGYRWSARSVLVDGGPQRPPTGLYAR